MRRTVGVGGAAAVALGAMLALALPASAHTPLIKASCDTDTGQASVMINLTNYVKKKHQTNTVTLTMDGSTVLLQPTDFDTMYPPDQTKAGSDDLSNWQVFPNLDGTVAHHFVMHVTSDDGIGAGDFPADSPMCPQPTKPTPPPPTQPTQPPSQSSSTPPPPSTTTAVVAAATTTSVPPGAGELASTGVNAGFPIAIAGLLVIAGGGILFFLRFKARKGNA
jgi:LPXTG-motif cell wall-anchored protein